MRVLLNIVSNGCYAAHMRKTKHTDETFEPTIAVSTKALNDRIEIRVRDNGVGIPDDIKAKIFNPFFTTKPAGEGTGLGLSLSYDIIVKQHGGTIDVVTKAGSFTEFRITLPRDGVAGPPSGVKP
jgi:signal transduction histidine kinase